MVWGSKFIGNEPRMTCLDDRDEARAMLCAAEQWSTMA